MAFPCLSLVLPPHLNQMPRRDTMCLSRKIMGGVKKRKIAKKVGGNVLFSMVSPDFMLLCVSIQIGNFRPVSWVWIL